jgi:hypothetical protein
MTKKPRKIQLVGSETLDEGIVVPPNSVPPATNDIGERIGSLETEISILKARNG